ncbi:MAG: carboxypeptidase-like regulatory domain-containing protein, partial [Syntrophothermus sp.]
MPDRHSVLKTIFTIILLFSIFTQPSLAQEPSGTIKGKVTSSDGSTGLTGITVLVKNSKLGAVTDEEGNYAILCVPAGSFVLEFRSVGYISRYLSDIQVKPGRISFADCGLQETAVEAGSVVVNGGYFQSNAIAGKGLVNFNSEEIRRSPGSMGDASRILMALPSVSKVSDDNNDLIVRGGSPSENGFYVDGIPVPNINHFPSIGSTGGPIGILNVDFIEGFDFHTSGFPSEYGDRLSSIIDIRFREGNREKVDVQADLNWAGFGAGAEG